MPLRILPLALFLIAVQARAAITVTVADASAEYSDEISISATISNEGAGMSGQQVTFTVLRADEGGAERVVVNAGVGVSDSEGIAQATVRLVNGIPGTNTEHELKPERSADDIWRSFSEGTYAIRAQRTAGDRESGSGTLTIRREQVALTVHPITIAAGQRARIAVGLSDSGDRLLDYDWTDNGAVESAKAGIQGRSLSLWMDRNGDQNFYNCTAGGSCSDGHCTACVDDAGCPGAVCDQGLCVAAMGTNSCSQDIDCASFAATRALHCVAGVCLGEACDFLGTVTTDVFGNASFAFDTAPDEFGGPSVGDNLLMLRASFGGDDYYAGVASKGDLFLAPAALDLTKTPITLSLNGTIITEVGIDDPVAIDVRAYLSDRFENLYGFNHEPYLIAEADCADCTDDYCHTIGHPSCLQVLAPEDVDLTATNGVFVTAMARNPQDGAFMRKWRPTETADSEVVFRLKIGDLTGGEAKLRLFSTGCGCRSAGAADLIFLLLALPMLRRRRTA